MAVEQWRPTPQELRLLPRFCQDRFRYGSSLQHPVIARWYRVFGKDFVHIHHYCAGLNFMNRADRAALRRKDRGFQLQRAFNNFTYIVEKVSPAFPLLPGAYYHRGRALERMGRTAEAVRDYAEAIRRKPRYAPPYVALARIHSRAGRRDEAERVLREGLAANPDSKLLRRALARLGRTRGRGAGG